jgi:hypothetical protein
MPCRLLVEFGGDTPGGTRRCAIRTSLSNATVGVSVLEMTLGLLLLLTAIYFISKK